MSLDLAERIAVLKTAVFALSKEIERQRSSRFILISVGLISTDIGSSILVSAHGSLG